MAEKSFNKLVDGIKEMSVMELADFVKLLEETFGVSGAMPTMAAAPSSAAPVAAAPVKKVEATKEESKNIDKQLDELLNI